MLANPHLVVPFLGAGMTLPAGLPDTNGLTRFLQSSALGRGVGFEKGDGLAETFNRLADAHSLTAVQTVTADHLTRLTAQAKDVPPAFAHLVEIPSRWIVTLSYDTLLERAATEAGRPFQSVTWTETERLNQLRAEYLTPELKSDQLVIFHLHGSVDDPPSLVADRNGYRGVDADGVVKSLLVALLSVHRTCWMGCSMDEPYLVALLGQLAINKATHCFISDETGVDAVRDAPRGRVSTGQHGVAFDHFPAGQWQHLPEFCQWLVKKQPVSRAPLTSGEPVASGGSARPPSSTHFVRSDWGPDWARKALDTLGEANPAELAILENALAAATSVAALIVSDPIWLRDGSWQLHLAVTRLIENTGDWPAASLMWERASARAGADKVRCLVGAAVAADVTDDDARRIRLMSDARAVDREHPRLRLQELGELPTPEEQLVQAAGLFDEDGDVGTLARCHAVVACLMADDLPGALKHLVAAEGRGSDLAQVRLARINYIVHEGRTAFSTAGRINAQQLQQAKEDALALRQEMLPHRRYHESCRLLMLAADATAVQGEFGTASEMLHTAHTEELDTPGGRIVLADAALRAQDHDGALRLLEPLASDEDVDAMRAQADLHHPDATVRLAARERMVELLDAGEHAAGRCAHLLAFTASEFPDLPFPEAAAEWFAAHGDDHSRHIARSLWLHGAGQPDEAVQLLRAHEPASWAFQAQLQLALWDEDRQSAARLAIRVLRDTEDPHLRVMCARQLAAADELERSQEVATALATDATVPAVVRGDAFALLSHLVVERRDDHEAGIAWLNRWREALPADRRHVWGRIRSLLRLGQHAEAADVLLHTSVAIESRAEAQIAARVYLLLPDRRDGLARLADLIESMPQRDPEMDQHAWLAVLQSGDTLPDDLVERLRPGAGFEMPGQEVSLDDLVDILRERQTDAAAVVADVIVGQAAVTKLAQTAGMKLAALWSEMRAKPAAFGAVEWDDLERPHAGQALIRGAVADPTALVTLTLLPEAVREIALRRLGHPLRIAQSTLDDVVASALDGAGTGKTLAYDPATGQPVGIEIDDAELERRRAALRAVRDLAVSQTTEPDARPEAPSRLDGMLDDDQEHPLGVLSLAASLAIADRTGRPLFSDDRVVRRIACQLGVACFGIGTLLQALVAANAVTAAEAGEAMSVLRSEGYSGMPPTPEELAHLTEDGAFDEVALRRIMLDPNMWDADQLEHLLRFVWLLHRLHAVDPSRFPERASTVLDWVAHRVTHELDRSGQSWRKGYVVMMILIALPALLFASDRVIAGGFVAALCTALERHAKLRAQAERGEIVDNAVVMVRRSSRQGLTLVALVQLPWWHQLVALGMDPDRATPYRRVPSPSSADPAGTDRPRPSRRARRARQKRRKK